MHQLNWAVTVLAAIGAALMLLVSFSAGGAPQQAAGAAIAVALVAIPYVWSRACDELTARRPLAARGVDLAPSEATPQQEAERAARVAAERKHTMKVLGIVIALIVLLLIASTLWERLS